MDVAGKSLVVGMLLERVGSAALLYMLVASTPYMGGLQCALFERWRSGGEACLFRFLNAVLVTFIDLHACLLISTLFSATPTCSQNPHSVAQWIGLTALVLDSDRNLLY